MVLRLADVLVPDFGMLGNVALEQLRDKAVMLEMRGLTPEKV